MVSATRCLMVRMSGRVVFAVGSSQLVRSGPHPQDPDKLAHGIDIVADMRAPQVDFPNP